MGEAMVGGGGVPSCHDFFENLLNQNQYHPHSPHTTSLKSKAPFQEMIPRKNQTKLETVINTCDSLIKQHWKNDGTNSTKT